MTKLERVFDMLEAEKFQPEMYDDEIVIPYNNNRGDGFIYVTYDEEVDKFHMFKSPHDSECQYARKSLRKEIGVIRYVERC